MPHEDVTYLCDVSICAYQEKGECRMDCDINELEADTTDCKMFLCNLEGFSKDFDSDVALEKMLETIMCYDVPFMSLDESSLHVQSVLLSEGKYGLVQGSEKQISAFRFWRDVDGGLGATDKNQLELNFA